MKKLHDLPARKTSLLVLCVVALYPFSHFPLLPVIDISPFQIAAVVIAVLGGISVLRQIVSASDKTAQVGAYKPLYGVFAFFGLLSLSFLWSSRTSHELYYIALMWVGLLFALGIYTLLSRSRMAIPVLVKAVIVAGVLLSCVALWQFVGESSGLERSYTGICPTCLQHDIGFARPSGFSQEPEHFSTVLFGPIVVALTVLFSRLRRRQQHWLWFSIFAMLTVFLLSASRSGFIALGVVLALYVIFAARRRDWLYLGWGVGVFVVSLIVALLSIAWSGTVGDKSGSAYVTERYLAHASGGLVVVGEERARLDQVESSVKQKEAAKQQAGADDFNYITEGVGQGPSGAIAYSAQSRLETYKTALTIWTDSVRNFIVGVGWGNFGAVAQQREPAAFTKSTIVNNQYLQIAVELGLVGILIFMYAFLQVARYVWRHVHRPAVKLGICALFGAYGLQLMFYSGLHLLQFWLSAAVVAYILIAYEKKTRAKKAV